MTGGWSATASALSSGRAPFAESVDLVRAIGDLPGIEEHQPAIDIRDDGVTVRLVTYEDDYFGPGKRDLELARAISIVARDMGFTSEPAVVQSVLIIPGALNIAEIMPFWEAVLGYERRRDSPDEDLVDSHDRGPAFWLEKMNEPRADGGGAIHVGIWVPIEVAEARVAAALAAGRRQDGSRRVRAVMVDARRRGRQRGGHRHHRGPLSSLCGRWHA